MALADPSATEIHIHAQFLLIINPNTEQFLNSANWKMVYRLAFPINELINLEFTSKLYK